jgi:hypothetical protein
MSRVKIVPNLYLGSNELKRLFKSNDLKNLFKFFILEFGINPKIQDSLKVIQGSGLNKVSLLKGEAIDENINLISLDRDLINSFNIPDNNVEHVLSVLFKYSNLEKGKVSIQKDGRIDGIGTIFTDTLRGVPINPVKIKFPNSVLNVNSYEILEVVDDKIAYLNSLDFNQENDLDWAVEGCFTAGISIPQQNRLIYENDSFSVEIKPSVSIFKSNEIKLASIRNNNGQMVIKDLRKKLKLI